MTKMSLIIIVVIIIIIIIIMTLFNEDAKLDIVQSSLGSSFKIYIQSFTMLP